MAQPTTSDILAAIRSASYSHADLKTLIGAVASVAGVMATDFDAGMERVSESLDAAFDAMDSAFAITPEQRDEFARDARDD